MSYWHGQLADGREIRIQQVRPPANFAELRRGKTLQSERFTFSGFLAPGGVKLLRVTEDGKEPSWVQVAVMGAESMTFTIPQGWTYTAYSRRAG